jgi:hypothetical protein
MVAVLLGALGYAGCVGYQTYVVPAQEAKVAKAELAKMNERYDELHRNFELKSAENERLTTAVKLLKVDRRLANVDIVATGKEENGDPYMDVEFYEVSGEGKKIGETRSFRLKGDELYVSTWVAQFEDRYVETGDLIRGSSLCVFKRIWGNLDGPNGGFALDNPDANDGGVPVFYENESPATALERKIWTDFWSVSNDPQKQKELGIRTSSGIAPFIQIARGQTYQYELRSSGGPSVKPLKPLDELSDGDNEETGEQGN